jgi:nucleoside-diphosphate-sugar epimerase
LRNVLYVEDAADILHLAAQQADLIGQTLFATSSQHLSVSTIASGIVEVFQSGSVEHIEWPDERRRIEVDHVEFSSARLQALTGWQPRHDFLTGLQKTRAIIEGKQ